MIFQERQYQTEAVNAVHEHICTKQTNPCVVLPTGSGKSVVMASVIQKWRTDSPWVRGCILAHRKELVQQNHDKLTSAYPGSEIGIFSAGLGRKDYDSPILFASIDSISKRAGEFQAFDFLFVDEAHRIPPGGEGKYRTFINGCRRFNPQLRVVGWTATPFRMGCGPICHKDHILQEVCYEAGITDLIGQGYLSKLRSKVGRCQPDLQGVRRNRGGDYIVKSLADVTNRPDIVAAAVAEACRIMQAECRRSAIFFCVDVEHCERVSKELKRHGVYAPFVTGKTKKETRDKLIQDFKDQKLNAICCINVLTEGFDAPHIDCIVLLRSTLSPGLFSQMVGRGLRISPGKSDCLVLDFAGCIDEHGPIDLLGEGQETVLACCSECRESFSRAICKCPACGWEIPKIEVERMEAEETERRMHTDKASKRSILSSREPEVHKVHGIFAVRHVKDGSPDSLKISYRCGVGGEIRMFREWICLDHDGFAGHKAAAWWRRRFAGGKSTVDDALGNLLLTQELLDWTKTVTVKKNGRHYEVVDYNAPLGANG